MRGLRSSTTPVKKSTSRGGTVVAILFGEFMIIVIIQASSGGHGSAPSSSASSGLRSTDDVAKTLSDAVKEVMKKRPASSSGGRRRPVRKSVFPIAGRVRVVPVGVAVPYSPVATVDDDLGSFVLSDRPGMVNRFGLGVVNGGSALVPLTADSPATIMRNDVLIFTHRLVPSFLRGLRTCITTAGIQSD